MKEKPRKSSLLIIFITVFIDLLGFGIVLPLLPRYGEIFNASGPMLGLLMAAFSAMQFIFAPLWGRVSDRIGRRPVLLVGLAGSCIFYGLFGYVSTLKPGTVWMGGSPLVWMFITRIGAGIAGATIPTAQAYIADVTGRKERGKGMALIGAAFGIGFTFGPLLGSMFVGDGEGPSGMPGYVASILSGGAFLFALFKLPESLSSESQPAHAALLDIKSLKITCSRPAIGRILITIFLTTFAFAQFESTLSLLTDRFGLDDRDNFFVFAYIGFVLTISQGMLVRRLMPRLGEFRMALVGVAFMCAGLLLIGLSAEQDSLRMLFAVLPISVIGFSALNPSMQSLLSLNSPAGDQGMTLGVGQSISAMARIFGPLAGLSLFKSSNVAPYYSAAGLMIVGLLLVVSLRGSEQETAGGTEQDADDAQPQ